MGKLDSLGRATFHHIASHEAVRPTNRELRWLSHINRHGPISSAALFDLTQDTHRCRDTGLRALQKLRAGGLLCLPAQQRQIERAEFHPYIYDVTAKGRAWLNEAGLLQASYRPSGHFWHAYTVAGVTSAFDRAAVNRDMKFIPAQTILDLRKTAIGIPHSSGTAIPDQIFAIDYGGAFRAFLLEVDRGTEPAVSRAARESLASKIAAYDQIARQNLHQQHYGLKSPVAILFTFFSRGRAEGFLERLAAYPVLAATTLVKVLPASDPLLLNGQTYVSEPWQRSLSGPMDILTKPAG
jgi:Replication-relaxation